MLETHFDKSISISGSNNAGVWAEESPVAGGQWGFGDTTSDALAIYSFFPKKYAFLGIFWPKFLLKNAFYKCLNKVC